MTIFEVLKIIGAFFGGGGIVAAIIFLNPEKAQIWASYLWKALKFLGYGIEKRYIADDIEGRINDFSRDLTKEIRNHDAIGVKINWVNENETVRSFFDDNKVMMRMRKSENQNENFVFASMTYISKALARRAKSYISQSQRESIDYSVAQKLFLAKKPEVMHVFVENFLSKMSKNKKISSYFDIYSLIDKVGLFFPVLLQELNFLGDKVFGSKREDVIIKEVDGLIDVLHKYAERELGEKDTHYIYNGKYCKFGIVIVARRFKVTFP